MSATWGTVGPAPDVRVRRHASHLGRWLHAECRPPHLAGLVDSIWYFDGRLTHRRERIYPDGRVELNIHLGPTYGQVSPGADGPGDPVRPGATGEADACAKAGSTPFPAVCLSGLVLRSAVLEAPPAETAVIGVRLWPAGAATLLGRPLHELAGVTVDLGDLVAGAAAELEDRCGEARGPGARLGAAVDWLTRRAARARRSGQGRPTDPAVAWAAAEIERHHGALSITRLRERAGWSRSRFSTAFRERIGVSAKHLARISRFRRALELLHAGALPLSDVALRAGYYDQPHFNAEFRAFADAAPGEYLRAARYPASVNVAEA